MYKLYETKDRTEKVDDDLYQAYLERASQREAGYSFIMSRNYYVQDQPAVTLHTLIAQINKANGKIIEVIKRGDHHHIIIVEEDGGENP